MRWELQERRLNKNDKKRKKEKEKRKKKEEKREEKRRTKKENVVSAGLLQVHVDARKENWKETENKKFYF